MLSADSISHRDIDGWPRSKHHQCQSSMFAVRITSWTISRICLAPARKSNWYSLVVCWDGATESMIALPSLQIYSKQWRIAFLTRHDAPVRKFSRYSPIDGNVVATSVLNVPYSRYWWYHRSMNRDVSRLELEPSTRSHRDERSVPFEQDVHLLHLLSDGIAAKQWECSFDCPRDERDFAIRHSSDSSGSWWHSSRSVHWTSDVHRHFVFDEWPFHCPRGSRIQVISSSNGEPHLPNKL